MEKPVGLALASKAERKSRTELVKLEKQHNCGALAAAGVTRAAPVTGPGSRAARGTG